MKHKLLLITLLVSLLTLSAIVAKAAQQDNDGVKQEQIVLLTKINCGGCAKTIMTKMSETKGVIKCEASKETQEVTIIFDSSKTNKKKLIAKMKKIGYPATEKV